VKNLRFIKISGFELASAETVTGLGKGLMMLPDDGQRMIKFESR
jgi:hypothetical protein